MFAAVMATVASAQAQTSEVSTQKSISVDGDPSDWVGTPGSVNTWVIDEGEGIWVDIGGDDTGDGMYLYPIGMHDDLYGTPCIFTAGSFDLTEFRTVVDEDYLYMMFRLRNMSTYEIATKWGGKEIGFDHQLVLVAIDTDQVSGSGQTDFVDELQANATILPSAAWEWLISINGRVPLIYTATGEMHDFDLVGAEIKADVSCDTIEVAIPTNLIGDPTDKTWRFTICVGGYDEGHFRQVWDTEVAENEGWPPFFRFMGGEGRDTPEQGLDPNFLDVAFTTNTAEQEEMLGNYQKTGILSGISAYHDITFGVPPTPSVLTTETIVIILLVVVIVILGVVLAKRK